MEAATALYPQLSVLHKPAPLVGSKCVHVLARQRDAAHVLELGDVCEAGVLHVRWHRQKHLGHVTGTLIHFGAGSPLDTGLEALWGVQARLQHSFKVLKIDSWIKIKPIAAPKCRKSHQQGI